MSKIDINALLKANPKAAEHAESIYKTLKDINDLREAGLHSVGFDLAPPFGRSGGLGGIVKVRSKGEIVRKLKRTHDA